MPNTYTLISSNVLTSSAASVTFSSIPSTYTDLVLKISARGDGATNFENCTLRFNGDTAANYSMTWMTGDGATATSTRSIATNEAWLRYVDAASATASTFGSVEVYLPNYTSSNKKPFSSIAAQENNTTTAYINATALCWQLTNAITSILIDLDGGSFVSGSSFYLYGIKNS
jgi:hypothetical protein